MVTTWSRLMEADLTQWEKYLAAVFVFVLYCIPLVLNKFDFGSLVWI